jgi:hypothetical protein
MMRRSERLRRVWRAKTGLTNVKRSGSCEGLGMTTGRTSKVG